MKRVKEVQVQYIVLVEDSNGRIDSHFMKKSISLKELEYGICDITLERFKQCRRRVNQQVRNMGIVSFLDFETED